jgi:hypothetical protein
LIYTLDIATKSTRNFISNMDIWKNMITEGQRLNQIIIDKERGKKLAEMLYSTFHSIFLYIHNFSLY